MTPDHKLIARPAAKRGPQALHRFKPRPGPEADARYLAWIRHLPCLLCTRQSTPTEAHHFGPRGFSRKSPDRQALPLCREHHRTGADSAHQLGRLFAHHHNIDPLAEIERLNAAYDQPVYDQPVSDWGGTAA